MYNRYLRLHEEAPEGAAPPGPPPGLSLRRPLPLPGRMEAGDLLLILILLLAWLEKKDEELLILLSALIVMSL